MCLKIEKGRLQDMLEKWIILSAGAFEEVYTGRTGFSGRSAVFGGSASSDLQLRAPAGCGGAGSRGGGGGVQVVNIAFCYNP